ncbi:MAG: hypothetical protein J7L15_01025 [Clostridiales bacterium]|nr:hypothetical protein [Clostridiales bacterium]
MNELHINETILQFLEYADREGAYLRSYIRLEVRTLTEEEKEKLVAKFMKEAYIAE